MFISFKVEFSKGKKTRRVNYSGFLGEFVQTSNG